MAEQAPDQAPVAVITGGSSGLGLALAEALARQGRVPVLLARNAERLERAAAQLRSQQPGAEGIPCDVTDSHAVQSAMERVRDRHGRVDWLILNAGVVTPRLLADYEDPEAIRREIEIDLWGAVLPAQVFLPLLEAGSRVLIISSGFGLIGVAGYAPYCAAKGGLVNFAESLRRELLDRGVSVHLACPSDIDTLQHRRELAALPTWMGMASARGSALSAPEAARRILKQCTRGRFLILSDGQLRLLRLLQHLLPGPILRRILDRQFPRP